MKYFIKLLACSLVLVWMTSAKSEVQMGVGLQFGQLDTSGTETEGTASDTSTRSKSFEEQFIGGDIFVEYIAGNGLTVGLSYVPLDIEIGAGSRKDANTEGDTGTRTASADVTDLTTLYANYPVSGDWYALAGVHMTTIKTEESLNASSYPDEDIFGYQIGFGLKQGNVKMELSYSDFEDIDISASGGNSNSVSADADAMALRISVGF